MNGLNIAENYFTDYRTGQKQNASTGHRIVDWLKCSKTSVSPLLVRQRHGRHDPRHRWHQCGRAHRAGPSHCCPPLDVGEPSGALSDAPWVCQHVAQGAGSHAGAHVAGRRQNAGRGVRCPVPCGVRRHLALRRQSGRPSFHACPAVNQTSVEVRQ